jgi:8-oxo-(d)GTP phosphatase
VSRTAVRAAGGVLWRPGGDAVEVAVVHRPRYDDWSLPKGKLDAGELEVEAAARELREETGWSGVVGRSLGRSRYEVLADGVPVPKSVHWWAVRATAGAFTPSDEVDELRWLPPEDAAALVTRPDDAVVLDRFTAAPADTRTLLLVRHGSAGSRDDWDGDDDLRPLDDRGAAQAAALARVLPLYGADLLVSAPLERCTATLRPAAEATGLDLRVEDALAGRCWTADPPGTLAVLRRLLRSGTAAACTQGEVLPEAVLRLAEGSSVVPAPPEARKGSVWVLSFAARPDGLPEVLLAADYLPSPLG